MFQHVAMRARACVAACTQVGLRSAILQGTGIGFLQFVMYACYALALWYGVQRIAAGKYTGGQVILVQFATLMGSFSLGQAAPNLAKFAAGQVSGYRMFQVINRAPQLVDVGRDADAAAAPLHLTAATAAVNGKGDGGDAMKQV
jgi:ABC-type bacteriocin/lantibiotic exporter with double-glycine peptidase domain